jgi:4-aminobutyrate aminotransferase-like enzyme/Ser/Thr protein kinase RdoA (MazF antagonist)
VLRRMLSRDVNRPRLTQEDARSLALNLYGVVGEAVELPSERDQNFRIDSKGGDVFVLKIASESEALDTLEFQNSAMMWLKKRLAGGRSPHIVPANSGALVESTVSSDGSRHFVRLVTHLPGKVLADVSPHTPDFLFGFGRFVGSVSSSLEGFSHPSASREFYWDLALAPRVIEMYLDNIADPDDRELVSYYLAMFNSEVAPRMRNLRRSVIHNDANDYNIVVSHPHLPEKRVFGILDFGDMVESSTVFEVAIAAAYAMLGAPNPLAAASRVVAGYHTVYVLGVEELDAIFPAICARLAMSVVISAYQSKIEPQNQYLLVSKEDAWTLLRNLRGVHPRFASYLLRNACGLEACPSSASVSRWLEANKGMSKPVLESLSDSSGLAAIDLSIGSKLIAIPDSLQEDARFSAIVAGVHAETGASVLVGRYLEPRLIYTTDQYREWDEHRTVHLGTDLFTEPGTPVLAPLDGSVHSVGDSHLPRDNGPTLVLQHTAGPSGPTFYTLYAHLSRQSLEGLRPGLNISAGDKIAEVGAYSENGGWPPHLHFQLIVDMLDMKGDFRGVAAPSQLPVWRSISPDPNHVLTLPEPPTFTGHLSTSDIMTGRADHIGSSLSIAYREPLNIVRGYMQYLYDEWGRQYLDAVNNVPHVGHSNPAVVKALSAQAAVLNTNTRYLHENLILYAKRLCAKLPTPLSVCYFVNSGSEANELALRLARTYTGRKNVIVIEGAYHGNTGELVNLSPYKFDGPGGKGIAPHVRQVRMPDTYRGAIREDDSEAARKYAADLKTTADEHTAAFLCEPMMGCGGQIVFPDGYLREAFRIVREAGGVCIADEVQTGFGRVGTHFWAFETQDVVPDIVTLGKPIGNGHPLGAVITTPEIAASFDNGMEYFSTTGGNPVSCAVGLAVLDEIERNNLQANAQEVGTHLLGLLKTLMSRHSVIGDVRGRGLFIGVELVRSTVTREPLEASYVVNRMKDLGVLVSADGPHHNVIKIKPPLVFTRDDAARLAATLDAVLSEDPVVEMYRL